MRRASAIPKILLCLFLLAACSLGASLRSRPVTEIAPSGTYNAVFYGYRYVGDLETVVFLKPASSQFQIKVRSTRYYSIVNGLSAPAAIKRAERFFSSNPNYTGISRNKILTPAGQLVGYEIRPLYQVFVYGTPDVLTTNYTLKDNTVNMYVELNPLIRKQRLLENGSEGGGHGGGGLPR